MGLYRPTADGGWAKAGGAGPLIIGLPSRESLVPGQVKPDKTNTGLRDGWTEDMLTVVNGDLTISTPGTVVENKLVRGRILVQAANVTISNVKVVGTNVAFTSSTKGLIDCSPAAASNVLIKHCEIVPAAPGIFTNCVAGHDYTIKWCNLYGAVDGIGVWNLTNSNGPANVVIEMNWIHDLSYFSPDSTHSDNRTHDDCIQIHGNSNIRIRGNTIEATCSTVAGNGYPGASPTPTAANPYFPSVTGQCIGITPVSSTGPVTDVVIELNWVDYGAQSITVDAGSWGTATGPGIYIRNNRFGRNNPTISRGGVSAKRPLLVIPSLTLPEYAAVSTAQSYPDPNGNVYDDTGLPVPAFRVAA